MKKLLGVIAAIVVILLVALVAAPFLIPVDTYKEQIARQVESATGRKLAIAGDIDLSLLPRTQLTVGQVSFSNADWAGQPQMAQLDRLRVRVDPFALLSGELRVESFVLERPTIHLAVAKDGTANWAFGGAGAAQPSAEGEAAQQPAGGGQLPLQEIGLEDVRLVDGTVTYTDMATGQTQELRNVNLSLSLAGLDSPFQAEGKLDWQGETVEVTLETGPPRALMAGQPTDVALKVDSQPLTLDYDGKVTNAEPRTLEGSVAIDVPSVKGLAQWAGNPLEAPEGTLEAFALQGQVSAKGPRYGFTAETLRLDKIEGSGEVNLDLAGAKPALTGRLDLARLDLTPYLPAPTEEGGGQAQAESGGGAGGAPTAWSDEPIDLAALHALNAKFDLSVEAIKAREVEIGRSALKLALEDGRLQADLTELQLYDGQGTGRIVLNARGEVPQLSKQLTLEGVQAKPLLTDAAGFERLEGTGGMTMDVTAQGRSQKAMVEALNGQGAISFQNGAVVGINLAQMVRNVGSAFTDAGGTQKTDFAELAGTFTIRNGVLKNDDLLLLNPLLRVRGAGTVDMPARTVNYRLTPKAVASLEGQGGEVQETGVAVPVIVEGPWHDLSYRPDLESLVRDALKDPDQMKEQAERTLKTLREGGAGGVKGVLEGLTGGGQATGGSATQTQEGETAEGGSDSATATEGGTDGSGTASPEQQIEEKAGEALKKLFGN